MASSPQHEPTMEEILASIRKIISEDSTDAPAPAPEAAAPPAPAPVMKAVEEDNILDLTQEMHPEPAPAPVAAVQAAPKEDDEIVFQSIEETPAPAPAAAAPQPSEIFSDKTRKAIDDTFAKLDEVEEPATRPAPKFTPSSRSIDGNSVEAVFERAVRDAVGPNIDAWMDEHFPALLEGAVREEVTRVLKARGKR
jgi:cell pole-organizing protein PopZ